MSSGELRVVKMHGTNNDFVLIDERPPRVSEYADFAKAVCDRAANIGADGLLVVREAPGYDAEMRIYNADGSEAEMCGNGVRCVARYLSERGAGDRLTIKTLAGPIEAAVVSQAPEYLIRLDMGMPSFPDGERGASIVAAGKTWHFLSVSMGNPHAVIFVDDLESVDFLRLGSEVATHPRFPHGTNVHVVQVLDRHVLRVKHYERGVGPTQACGTGAVACAVAASIEQRCSMPMTVRVPGGALGVSWHRGAHASLTGPAVTVFEREIAL